MQLADIGAVVAGVIGGANAFEIGRGGDPDVTGAALVQQPGDFSAAGSGDQLRRERG
jgi:hypothetical protein